MDYRKQIALIFKRANQSVELTLVRRGCSYHAVLRGKTLASHCVYPAAAHAKY